MNERTTDFLPLTPEGEQEEAKLFFSTEIPTKKKKQPIINTPSGAGGLNTANPYKLICTTDTAIYYIQGGLPKTTDNLKIMLVIENKATGIKARNRIDLYEDKQVERLCKEAAEKLQLRKDLVPGLVFTTLPLLCLMTNNCSVRRR